MNINIIILIVRTLTLMTYTKLHFRNNFKNLDYREHFLINKLKSSINLAETPYSGL